ncbi:hypothetical protein [Streptomyces sp. KLOTTS4A1]|uniref:hypothetical protein n=1 Tax=Streptomyces sp. KLOTTS4A1 TaxID=3390996 RepID=UPI0039F47E48
MADEDNRWLTKDAAERLLRGEPLDAVDGRRDGEAAQRAARLARTLDALRLEAGAGAGASGEQSGAVPGGLSDGASGARADGAAGEPVGSVSGARSGSVHGELPGELPGEAAAVAAFRAAGHGAAASGAAASAAAASGAAGAASDTPVMPVRTRKGAHAVPAGAGRLWARPLRFGLAAALAVGAIGGVAVAAGTGVLPTPFGGDDPGPAATVSAAATPPDAPEPGVTSTDGAREPSAATGGSSGPAEPGEGEGDTTTDTDGSGGKDASSEDGKRQQWAEGDSYDRTVEACRARVAGRPLDEELRKRLEKAADGAERVGRFCSDVLAGKYERGDGEEYDGGVLGGGTAEGGKGEGGTGGEGSESGGTGEDKGSGGTGDDRDGDADEDGAVGGTTASAPTAPPRGSAVLPHSPL